MTPYGTCVPVAVWRVANCSFQFALLYLIRVDDLPAGRRTLRSANANCLVVPPVKLSTVSSRAFAVAAPHIWNTLPTDVVAASSLSIFRRLLKRFLFKQLPDIIYSQTRLSGWHWDLIKSSLSAFTWLHVLCFTLCLNRTRQMIPI